MSFGYLTQQRNLVSVDIRDFGASPGATGTINSAAYSSAITTLGSAGGLISSGPGTYLFNANTIYPFIYCRGAGKGATVWKLANNQNTDLFSAQTNLIDLTAASSPGAGTLYNFGFANMTLDGNKANQSGGPSYPLRFYGYSYIMQNLEIRNGYSGNVLSDWNGGNTFATDSMEAQWSNVKTHDSNGIGMELGGPHDSQFMNIVVFEEGSHCMHLAPKVAGAMFKNLHAWGPGLAHGAYIPGINSGPTVYGDDSFLRANQSGLGTASDGQVWTESPSSSNVTANIVSHQGSFTGNGGESDSAFTLGTTSVGNIDFYARVSLGGDSANNALGLVWHFTDINNYYRAIVTGNRLYLQKWVAGVKTTPVNVAFALGNSTYAWMRVQMSGTTIKIKMWLDGQIQGPSWLINTTDSSLGAGKFGIAAWINSGTGVVDNFHASALRTQSGSVAMLQECTGVQYDGCTLESSDTVQFVLCGSDTVWEGGSIYDGQPSISSGIQIGQQAGETPYLGQIFQTAGLTNGYASIHNKISTYIKDCQGDNGALWLDNDGGFNVFDVSINQDLVGIDRTGSLSQQSVLRGSYDDGTHTTSGTLLLDSPIQIQKAGTIYSGSGVPNDANTTKGSINGDFYFRTDMPGSANQRLYVKASGSWSGIL